MSISSLASECATQVAGVIPDRIAAAYSFEMSLSANPKPTAAMVMETRSHCCSANGRIAKRTRFPGNILYMSEPDAHGSLSTRWLTRSGQRVA